MSWWLLSPGEANRLLHDPTYKCAVADPYTPGYLANVSGFPAVSVPMGFTKQGLPVGLTFFGSPYSEPKLLGFAYAYEQETQHRKPPKTTPALPGEIFEYPGGNGGQTATIPGYP